MAALLRHRLGIDSARAGGQRADRGRRKQAGHRLAFAGTTGFGALLLKFPRPGEGLGTEILVGKRIVPLVRTPLECRRAGSQRGKPRVARVGAAAKHRQAGKQQTPEDEEVRHGRSRRAGRPDRPVGRITARRRAANGSSKPELRTDGSNSLLKQGTGSEQECAYHEESASSRGACPPFHRLLNA